MRPSRSVPAHPSPSRPHLPRAIATAAAVLALGALAGCTADPAPSASPTRSASASRSPHPSGSASAAATPTPSASATATPVSIPCTTLVSPQTVYDFNPIYSAKSPFTPDSGTPAARVRADRGTACEWINTSSGATIVVAVGRYTPSALAAIKASSFTGGASASWGGDAGYFAASGGAGTATALVGSMWVTARGAEFLAASDADPFMRSAVAAARSAG